MLEAALSTSPVVTRLLVGVPVRPQKHVSRAPPCRRNMSARALCITIPHDRGDESFADDLNMGRGIVSGRVALLLRSTEIPPHRPNDLLPPPPNRLSGIFPQINPLINYLHLAKFYISGTSLQGAAPTIAPQGLGTGRSPFCLAGVPTRAGTGTGRDNSDIGICWESRIALGLGLAPGLGLASGLGQAGTIPISELPLRYRSPWRIPISEVLGVAWGLSLRYRSLGTIPISEFPC
jgi:hypothetical protein